EQRPGAERVAEAAAPAVGVEQAADEVPGVVAVGRAGEEVVERLHIAGGDVLPEKHGPRHVDVGGLVAVQQVVDLVREVLVARDDPDVEVDAGALLELACVTLDAGNVGVGVRREEADGGHRANVTPTRYARCRWSGTRSTLSWTPAGAPGS